MAPLRTLGVHGKNLPAKKTKTVQPSDFLIGGVIGQFERKYDKAFLVNGIEEFQEIFGNHINASFYGWDAVKGFFDNAAGVQAKAYIVSQVGNTGSALDAVVASRTVQDDGVEDSLKLEAAYQEELEYGVSGNRTATKLTLATRFATEAAGAVAATGVSLAQLDSVAGIVVGDIALFEASGGTPADVYHKITAIDEYAKTVSWSGDFSAAAATLAVDDPVSIPGVRIQTYRQGLTGLFYEVEIELGVIICSMESEVATFYAPNVHATNKWIKASDAASVSTLGDRLFTSDSDPVYLASGADGTTPTTAAHWADSLALLDNLPIRVFCNPETTVQTVNEAAEVYAKARVDDTPIFIPAVAENQTKAQLITIGQNYQRSDEVHMVIAANWLKVEDPFASSSIAPPRVVPNVGHVMGNWIKGIGQNGVHYIPAIKSNPLRGVVGIVGDQFLTDRDRTDIAEAGVNIIQDLDGIGVVVRNFFTPSTDVAYQFANGPLMRNFIKVSIVDSLQTSENLPNSLNRIKEDRTAALQFLYRLWERGSTGSVPTGETFGQTQDIDGNESRAEDHFEVKADAINNPQSSIDAGERTLAIYFTRPAPTGSIEVGVGILLTA